VAIRLWYGLDILPAIPDADDMCRSCCNVSVPRPGVARSDCKEPLDAKGRHAVICPTGGSVVIRHNYLRDGVGHALRALLSGVWWERREATDKKEGGEAQLDLTVEDPIVPGLLDFVVCFPVRPDGRNVYKLGSHVTRKFGIYPRSKEGRRLTSMPLIPVVLNIFGKLNELAVQYFARVESVARKRGKPFRATPGGARSLAELASLLVVLNTASIVRQAYSHRRSEGQAQQGDADAGANLVVGEEASRCTVCSRFRVESDLPVTCVKCTQPTCHKPHQQALDGKGRAAACKLGRCPETCQGRAEGDV
jgi:hypothetical protein